MAKTKWIIAAFTFFLIFTCNAQAFVCLKVFPDVRTISCPTGSPPSSYKFEWNDGFMSCAQGTCPRCGGTNTGEAIYMCNGNNNTDCGNGYQITAKCSSGK